MAKKTGVKLIANNKKAYHDFFIEETFEAGIALVGTEVKSLRQGSCSIKEAFIRVEKGEVYVYQMHIAPYEKGNIFNRDPLRIRKLLLHRTEINRLIGQQKMKGYTIVPLQVYFKDSLVKIEIGLARGKKLYDKREDIAKKDAAREAARDFKIRNLE
ncbi:MAG: SsrA-binding protein SmpB [Lachnospiraceae bacterium]|nr:SsrA-binding protein SmpB [Lachnospiraceae bacterium]